MVFMVKLYQMLLSPLLGKNCRFSPTCSQYAVEAIKKYGPIEGFAMALWRLLRCGPWSAGGYDPPNHSPFRKRSKIDE